jgi:hypothetical protein
MQRYAGLVVGIGVVPEDCFTLYHVAEELHPLTYALQYGTDPIATTIVDGTNEIPYQVIPLRPDRVRRYGRAERMLIAEGILRFYAVKGLKLSAAPARKFLERCRSLIDAGRFYSWRSRWS